MLPVTKHTLYDCPICDRYHHWKDKECVNPTTPEDYAAEHDLALWLVIVGGYNSVNFEYPRSIEGGGVGSIPTTRPTNHKRSISELPMPVQMSPYGAHTNLRLEMQMSTRSVIAKRTGEHTFEGTYHHWDGYPTSLGKTLYDAYNGHFQKHLPAMLDYLLAHTWSTINGKNLSIAPGFVELGGDTKDIDQPQCYCHGDRSEDSWKVNQDNASASGCEWAYVFDSERGVMLVMSSYHENGAKAIGMFGTGDPDAVWVIVGEILLDATVEDGVFEKIETGG